MQLRIPMAVLMALTFVGSQGRPVAQSGDPFEHALLGDWGGLRARMLERGLTLELESTHSYQGLLAGDGDADGNSDDFEYGGHLDAFLSLDTDKFGLWPGGRLHTHVEYTYGDLPPYRGGAQAPVSTSQALPTEAPEEVEATAIYLRQGFGERASVMLGKINTVDLLAGDLFFGGGGNRRFMNLLLVAPPNGLQPGSIMGGLATLKTDALVWNLMAFDPEDRTEDYTPDDLFHDGVNVSLSATRPTRLAGRTTSCTLTGIYSTQDSLDLNDVLLPPGVEGGTKEGSYHVSVLVSHLLYEEPAESGVGWGLFLKLGLSDGNPNPYQAFATGGVGGKGLFSGRAQDSFGLGLFYYDLSDDLQSTLDPLLDFDDEFGGEAYYSYAATPWLRLSADLQVISPATSDETAVVAGLRANFGL